ncbi:MAG: ATP-binding protein [Azonexus sp.]|nr:ATP-binding protein [Azonexus sp.]
MFEIGRQAEALGVSKEVIQRLQLIVEEIFINTLAHGYQGDEENHVQLGINLENGILTLRVIDSAPPFDLTQATRQTATSECLGGLGVGLIHGLSKAIRYQRLGQQNITEIEL